MSAPTIPDRATARRTVTLDREADRYLSRMIGARTGHGRFLSILLLEDKMRRELTASQPLSTQETPQIVARVEE